MAFANRFVLAILYTFIVGSFSTAQDLKIVGGDVKTVEVDKVVVVKEQLLLVGKVPFSITAPTGGVGYIWDVPSNATWKRRNEVVEITAAPKGMMTVSVEWNTAEIVDGKIKFTSRSASIMFAVGEVGPAPKPPDPKPPEPSADNPFVIAWKTETIEKRASYAAVIAGLYNGYAREAKTAMTGKALFEFMSNAYLLAETGGEKVSGKLTKLVPVVNQWLANNLKVPEGPLIAADRMLAEIAFLKVAAWLRELQ